MLLLVGLQSCFELGSGVLQLLLAVLEILHLLFNLFLCVADLGCLLAPLCLLLTSLLLLGLLLGLLRLVLLLLGLFGLLASLCSLLLSLCSLSLSLLLLFRCLFQLLSFLLLFLLCLLSLLLLLLDLMAQLIVVHLRLPRTTIAIFILHVVLCKRARLLHDRIWVVELEIFRRSRVFVIWVVLVEELLVGGWIQLRPDAPSRNVGLAKDLCRHMGSKRGVECLLRRHFDALGGKHHQSDH
mmetsp:Transcript_144293/g.251535  ORF Transcript_144293/g.251535 Transcript_144293/m.251535 type:complete len:240 (-) Transcript_144293:94-813(-)